MSVDIWPTPSHQVGQHYAAFVEGCGAKDIRRQLSGWLVNNGGWGAVEERGRTCFIGGLHTTEGGLITGTGIRKKFELRHHKSRHFKSRQRTCSSENIERDIERQTQRFPH
jgi:hypothetical protein